MTTFVCDERRSARSALQEAEECAGKRRQKSPEVEGIMGWGIIIGSGHRGKEWSRRLSVDSVFARQVRNAVSRLQMRTSPYVHGLNEDAPNDGRLSPLRLQPSLTTMPFSGSCRHCLLLISHHNVSDNTGHQFSLLVMAYSI